MKCFRAAANPLLIRSNAPGSIATASRSFSSLLLASKLSRPATATVAHNQHHHRHSTFSSNQAYSFRLLRQLPTSSSCSSTRPFSSSSACQKKKGKGEEEDGRRGKKKGGRRGEEGATDEEANTEPTTTDNKKGKKGGGNSSSSPSSSSSSGGGSSSSSTPADPNQPVPSPENPYEFSDLVYAFDKAEKRYAEELRKLRGPSGGRFNAESISAIPVTLDKHSHSSFPLRELATVAPLGGRRWSILAFEEDSVKHIQAAVLRSPDFNQQPQRSEDNPLELTMTVELERGDSLAKHAKEICESWRNKIRDETHKRESLHKKWKAGKLIVDDDLFKLREKMKKLQDEKMKVVTAKEKEVVAQIMARTS